MIIDSDDFTIDIMDALVRLYQQMDDDMYEKWSEKRWRHFLPTDFVVRHSQNVKQKLCLTVYILKALMQLRTMQVAALNSDIHMSSGCVEHLFLGSHITYNVADCRLVSRKMYFNLISLLL